MATTEEQTFLKDIAFNKDLLVTPSGDLDTITGLANLKEALFRRLVTTPGAIFHRPTYGVGIQRFQNAIGYLETKREIALLIQEQFEADPRVEKVTGVTINSDDESPERTEILVRVKPIGRDEATLDFVPFGE